VGILGTLQTIFVVLKIMNIINWRWATVFAPFWIWLALGVICFVIGMVNGRKNA
jgi:hypothetical protein